MTTTDDDGTADTGSGSPGPYDVILVERANRDRVEAFAESLRQPSPDGGAAVDDDAVGER